MSTHDQHQPSTEPHTCPTCDAVFKTRGGMRQHHAILHGESLPNRTCKGCGERFYDSKSELQYCEQCEPHAGSNNPNWRGGKETTACVQCGSSFEYYPSEKPGRFCAACVADPSVSCTMPRETNGTVSLTCSHCETKCEVYASKAKGQQRVFCDRSCYRSWLSAAYRRRGAWVGADNPNWVDGAHTKEYYTQGWTTARKKALTRDNYTCQRCEKTKSELGRNPDVHHIVPVRDFDEVGDAHALENLVSLCQPCHLAVERQGASITCGSGEE